MSNKFMIFQKILNNICETKCSVNNICQRTDVFLLHINNSYKAIKGSKTKGLSSDALRMMVCHWLTKF
jgi:hypothetical protein